MLETYALDTLARILNSTFLLNSARSEGGAVYMDLGSELHLLHCTLSDNHAEHTGPAIYNTGRVTIANSILVANGEGEWEIHTPVPGETSSVGYNLLSSVAAYEADFSFDARDIVSDVPGLAALADNGGATRTMALLEGSPAIDAVPAEACVDLKGERLTVDQRGESRPVGAGCDIGAYELK